MANSTVQAVLEMKNYIPRISQEAIKTGAVDRVLGIDDIYSAIEKQVLAICQNASAGVR